MVAVGCDNQHHAMPFGRCARNGSASADAFVIGMGVKANES
jgi:hypothetical protein